MTNVLFDCAALIVAVALVTILTMKTSKLLASFFVLPLTLLGVHVYGNTVQELGLGPEWIRNHLHNMGVAGISIIGALFALLTMRTQRGYTRSHIETARYAMNMVLCYWLISSGVGVGIEILTVTIWGANVEAAGYSGKLDWFDLSAYAVGAIIVIANYAWLKPRILTKMRQQDSVNA